MRARVVGASKYSIILSVFELFSKTQKKILLRRSPAFGGALRRSPTSEISTKMWFESILRQVQYKLFLTGSFVVLILVRAHGIEPWASVLSGRRYTT